jgi:hypothetical protein
MSHLSSTVYYRLSVAKYRLAPMVLFCLEALLCTGLEAPTYMNGSIISYDNQLNHLTFFWRRSLTSKNFSQREGNSVLDMVTAAFTGSVTTPKIVMFLLSLALVASPK